MNKSICCKDEIIFYFNKKYKYKNFQVFRCKNCNSGYVHPYPKDEVLIDLYANENYKIKTCKDVIKDEEEFPNSSIDSKRIIENLLHYKKDNKKDLLDVGCGSGWICKEAMNNNFNVTATELNLNNRNLTFEMSGVKPLDRIIDSNFCNEFENKFDFIVLSQVLEHLKVDNYFLDNLSKLLKKDGILVIAVPNFSSFLSFLQGKNDMFIIPPEHINYFTFLGLKNLFMNINLEVINYETVSRYDKFKLKKQNKLLSFLFPILDVFFYVSDKFNKGIFINIYLRK